MAAKICSPISSPAETGNPHTELGNLLESYIWCARAEGKSRGTIEIRITAVLALIDFLRCSGLSTCVEAYGQGESCHYDRLLYAVAGDLYPQHRLHLTGDCVQEAVARGEVLRHHLPPLRYPLWDARESGGGQVFHQAMVQHLCLSRLLKGQKDLHPAMLRYSPALRGTDVVRKWFHITRILSKNLTHRLNSFGSMSNARSMKHRSQTPS